MLGCLHNQTLDKLIELISFEMLMPSSLSDYGLYQLYQALDWLQPVASKDAQLVDTWVCVKAKIGKLGPRPVPSSVPYEETELVHAALTQLRLRFAAETFISTYWAAAIVEPRHSGSSIILSFKAYHFIRNKSVRQLGKEYFRQELLGRHGKLVLVDRLKPASTVEEVVAYLEPILTAAAGGSLDAYRHMPCIAIDSSGPQVLLTPPRAGAAEQKVADYLKPTLTAASGGYLDAYRIECKHSSHCDETGTIVN